MPADAPFLLRDAVVDDRDAIAELHWASWDAQLAGRMPMAIVGANTVAARRDQWRVALLDRNVNEERIVVAVVGPTLLGVAHVGGDELYRLYVAPRAQRRGVGHALLEASIEVIRAAGHAEMRVNV